MYITNSVSITSQKINENNNMLSRAFHNLSWNHGVYNLTLNFGIHNQDHPAIIRRNEFTIDLDAFYSGSLEFKEVEEKIELFHTKIQELFEYSIKNPLREKMGWNQT